jgi:hypothetical protein
MADETEKTSAQEMYGAGTIVSSPPVDPLAGRTISIQTSNTNKFESKVGNEIVLEGTPPVDPVNPEGTPEVKPEDTPKEETPQTVEQQVQNQIEAGKTLEADLTSKGVDFKALETEFLDTGKISPESREILSKAGYAPQIVDSYIAGLTATAERLESEVYQLVGGKENYAQLTGHIKTLGQSYIDAYNQTLETGNMATIGMILNGVKAQLVTARGTQNPSILGTKPASTAPEAFKTRSEMVAAMTDKRYNRDRAYTEAVRAKTIVSNF